MFLCFPSESYVQHESPIGVRYHEQTAASKNSILVDIVFISFPIDGAHGASVL